MSAATYIPTAAVVSYDEDSGVNQVGQIARQKQGHKCCGCCCDTRRAVIVVNIVKICFVSLFAILLMLDIAVEDIYKENPEEYNDDELEEEVEELEKLPLGFFLFLTLVMAVTYVFGILGAITYTPWMVYCAMVGYAISVVSDLLTSSIVSLFVSGFFLYPHVMFIYEMKQMIMTPENYANEIYSCCCT